MDEPISDLERLKTLISNLVLEAAEYVEVGYLHYPGPIKAQKALDEELAHWERTK